MKIQNDVNKTVGFTCSAFDLLHAGHILMLAEAKSQCDYLIVGLQTDPTTDRDILKNIPVQNIVERQIQLAGCKYVDEVVVYTSEKELEDLFLTLPIDVRFIGEEYRDSAFTGLATCNARGIEIIYNTRQHRWSTSELRARINALKI